MKKITAFLLALMMITGMSAAFAATKSAEDVEYITVIGEGTVEIVWTTEKDIGDDGDGTEDQDSHLSPAKEARKAQANGSALDVLPQELRDQLPEGFTVVNEVRTAKLVGDLITLDNMNELKAVVKFETPYAEGTTVYLAIGIPGEEAIEWVLLKGVANADQNVEVTFDHDTLVKIGENEFTIMAISEK